MSALFYTQIDDSPVGPLLLAGDTDALHVLAFGVGSRPREIDAEWKPDTKGVLKDVRKELDQYFAGTPEEVHDATRVQRHAVPERGVEAADAHSLRRDDQLSRAREAH